MTIPDRNEAERDFSPHYERLAAALLTGIREYEETPPKLRAMNRARSRSSNINDYIIHHVQEEFANDRDVVFVERHGAVQMVLANKYRARFKKLGSHLRSFNVPTQAVMAFIFQIQQVFAHTPDPLVNVDIGYKLNKAGAVEGIYITCPNGRHNAWAIPLPMDDAASAPTVIQPAGPQPSQPPQRRITAKPSDQDAARER